MESCNIENCDKFGFKRKCGLVLCPKHNDRWNRYGNFDAPPMSPEQKEHGIYAYCKKHGHIKFKDCIKSGKHPNGTTRYRCKPCKFELVKKYETKYRSKYLSRKRRYDSMNQKRQLSKLKGRLRRQYGMTLEQYEDLLQKQNNCCGICKKEEKRLRQHKNNTSKLCVDHCHKTGKIRGLLCWSCNAMIGMAKDSIPILQASIEWLASARS